MERIAALAPYVVAAHARMHGTVGRGRGGAHVPSPSTSPLGADGRACAVPAGVMCESDCIVWGRPPPAQTRGLRWG
eukprot:1936552-Prymnesium_polylepis.1